MHNTDWKRRHFIALAGAGAALQALPAQAQVAASARPAPTKTATLLVLGDSLSAEYGLARGTGWVALLTQKLQAHQLRVQVINASVSGETTAGGRTRLPVLLAQHQPAYVVIELGGNDALRGLPLAHTEANLRAMVQAASAQGARSLLLGMEMPPNYGAAFARDFAQIYPRVAKDTGSALVPFFLKNVADAADPLALFQRDRIHPNAQAQPLMLDNVWPALLRLLQP